MALMTTADLQLLSVRAALIALLAVLLLLLFSTGADLTLTEILLAGIVTGLVFGSVGVIEVWWRGSTSRFQLALAAVLAWALAAIGLGSIGLEVVYFKGVFQGGYLVSGVQ